MTIYFTSDTHWGHKNILKYTERGDLYSTIEEHDEDLIARWNDRVGPDDDIYHLGDFAFLTKAQLRELMPRLNGNIRLLLGNHDKLIRDNTGLKDLFAWVGDYVELKIPDEEMDLDQVIILFHYPIESWNKRHHGAWHLHGHCHGTLPSGVWQPRVDVGVDVWDCTPVSYDEIKEHMTKKVMKPVDHHGRRRR